MRLRLNQRYIPVLLFLAGLIPIACGVFGYHFGSRLLEVLSLAGWGLGAVLLSAWLYVERKIRESAKQLKVDFGNSTAVSYLLAYTSEIERRSAALVSSVTEQRIASREELAHILEKIAGLSYRLLDAESVELALLDTDTGLYHSSLVLGKPFRKSSQMMLEETSLVESADPGVLIADIRFAGSVFGTLRVALKGGRNPSEGDRQIVSLLALQSSMAVINAQFTRELLKMRRVSDESVKAKTGFLANLSHEIRGPLSIMLNAVELVLEGLCGPVTQDQCETLAMVKTNGKHLLDLINDVLDYAKAESGRVSVSPVAIDVDEILSDLAKVIGVQAEAKKHKVIHSRTTEPVAFSCDRRHARQILINLLTNAVKYTPEGGLIELWAERAPGNHVRICVKDSGVGIDNRDRDKVFSAFERIENEYSSKQFGTGLGMSLTRKLVRLNGGTIDFSSRPGKGSLFWILFPTTERAVEASPEEKKACEISGQGKTVLILSENNEERRTIGRYLARLHFAMAYAESAKDAIEALSNTDVNVAIIDNSMGEIEKGAERELVNVLRNKARNSKLPIILLSPRAFAFDVEQYLRAGVDKCLAKPVELQELARTCSELLPK